MDRTRLNDLIQAFRNETQKEAITPDSLGFLLSQIVDVDTQGDTVQDASQFHIKACVADGFLYILGADKLLAQGYIPYLFRKTKKVVRYREEPRGKYHETRKGWNRMGNHLAIKINPDSGLVQFNTSPHCVWHLMEFGSDKIGMTLGDDYDMSAETLMQINMADESSNKVTWGSKKVDAYIDSSRKSARMLRFPFAIAFAKEKIHPYTRQSDIEWVSNLAEFSVVFGCRYQDTLWHFSK